MSQPAPPALPGQSPSPRIALLDALRGSALLGILLLHSIEHWDFSRYPPNPPPWLAALNTHAHDIGFFLFGGKAYAIFALLFGVSFFLILDRWSRRGIDFHGRFLWRLAVLGLIGYLHGIVYCGDILLVIAVLGLPLAYLNRLGSRTLLWISIALVLQIPSLWETGRVLLESGYAPVRPRHWAIYGQITGVFARGSFLDVTATNLWQGQWSRIWWTIETGRYTQMLGLFILGLLLARKRFLVDPLRARRLALHALAWGALGFLLLYPIKLHLGDWGLRDLDRYVVNNLASAYCNLAQTAVWAGGFILLFQWTKTRPALNLLAPFGRMSLTCYVTQGLVGVPLFYNYGLGLYRHLGPFYSVLLGIGLAAIQGLAAHGWLKRFHYGPIEWLWRCATLLTFQVPFRKRETAPPGTVEALSARSPATTQA